FPRKTPHLRHRCVAPPCPRRLPTAPRPWDSDGRLAPSIESATVHDTLMPLPPRPPATPTGVAGFPAGVVAVAVPRPERSAAPSSGSRDRLGHAPTTGANALNRHQGSLGGGMSWPHIRIWDRGFSLAREFPYPRFP